MKRMILGFVGLAAVASLAACSNKPAEVPPAPLKQAFLVQTGIAYDAQHVLAYLRQPVVGTAACVQLGDPRNCRDQATINLIAPTLKDAQAAATNLSAVALSGVNPDANAVQMALNRANAEAGSLHGLMSGLPPKSQMVQGPSIMARAEALLNKAKGWAAGSAAAPTPQEWSDALALVDEATASVQAQVK